MAETINGGPTTAPDCLATEKKLLSGGVVAATTSETCTDLSSNTWPCPYEDESAPVDVVTVFQDPISGRWNVADYNTLHETGANSPQEAVAAYDPTYYKQVFLEDDGGMPTNRAVFFSPKAQSMRRFMRTKR